LRSRRLADGAMRGAAIAMDPDIIATRSSAPPGGLARVTRLAPKGGWQVGQAVKFCSRVIFARFCARRGPEKGLDL